MRLSLKEIRELSFVQFYKFVRIARKDRIVRYKENLLAQRAVNTKKEQFSRIVNELDMQIYNLETEDYEEKEEVLMENVCKMGLPVVEQGNSVCGLASNRPEILDKLKNIKGSIKDKE